jgi:hypothetical protein
MGRLGGDVRGLFLEMAFHRSPIVNLILGILVFCAVTPCAWAASPSVTAVLTSSETEVDQPVQLQIRVSGDSSATRPSEISVDGLDIRYTGESQEFRLDNFNATRNVVYNYTILPLKAGSYTIPSQVVGTGSGSIRTQPLTLNVSPNGDGNTTSRRGGGRNTPDMKKIVFCELVIPKTTAYVGETIPAEIRLGFNSRVPSRFVEPANLSGQGFTSQRMKQPEQNTRMINGQVYEIVTFKTAITPVKSGKLEIAAKDAKAIVQIPRRTSTTRQRSPFDIFGMDDPFNDPFFADPFGGMGEQREVKFSSDTTTIDVKPLPPNAPASFSGAVGNFSLTSEVKPKSAQVGDPLTVTARISGRGNFDRVNAPDLTDTHGWHTYPPSSNFKADDDIGISGTKSFELVLTPNEPKKAVPQLAFSYFDPLKGAYVTLKGDRMPVIVEGTPLTTGAPAIASASATPAGPAAKGPTPTEAQDILYQLNDHGLWGQSFTPIFFQPVFWGAQAVPFLGLICFFGWQSRKRRLENREEQRRTAWEHEMVELQKKLRRARDPADQYFAEALRLVQLKTALVRRIEPNTVDAETAVAAFDLPDEKRDRVRDLFRRSDELRYSGRPNGNGTVEERTRREVVELIESLD